MDVTPLAQPASLPTVAEAHSRSPGEWHHPRGSVSMPPGPVPSRRAGRASGVSGRWVDPGFEGTNLAALCQAGAASPCPAAAVVVRSPTPRLLPPAQANHPAVVTTFGGCEAFGARILVLEILPGGTLASLVAAHALPQAREAPRQRGAGSMCWVHSVCCHAVLGAEAAGPAAGAGAGDGGGLGAIRHCRLPVCARVQNLQQRHAVLRRDALGMCRCRESSIRCSQHPNAVPQGPEAARPRRARRPPQSA